MLHSYLKALLSSHNIEVTESKETILNVLVEDFKEEIEQAIQINKNLVDKFQIRNKIKDISDQWVSLPNATVGKPYEHKVDIIGLGWDTMVFTSMEGHDELGMAYDNENEIISGIPSFSGDHKIKFLYRLQGEADDVLNEKVLNFIVNPNPRSLWKNIGSNTDDVYWKADEIFDNQKLGDRQIVVASKRGRSHANAGTFRDDDFAFKHFSDTGWSIISVADGAGSASQARQGAKIACKSVVDYTEEHFKGEKLVEFDQVLAQHHHHATDETNKYISTFVYENLSKMAYYAHKKIEEEAVKCERSIKDYHTTLIFTLLKKYEFGYAVLTFGVGDCPIGLLNKDLTEIKLMNWLDVGEFGGGTRFVTMPEIFSSDKFVSRFRFKLVDDFSYLMLMTDGIYDPKFIVEANLERIEKWKEFIADLKGANEENTIVDFSPENENIGQQLSTWLDFWSSGNHDDRTLAIIY